MTHQQRLAEIVEIVQSGASHTDALEQIRVALYRGDKQGTWNVPKWNFADQTSDPPPPPIPPDGPPANG